MDRSKTIYIFKGTVCRNSSEPISKPINYNFEICSSYFFTSTGKGEIVEIQIDLNSVKTVSTHLNISFVKIKVRNLVALVTSQERLTR